MRCIVHGSYRRDLILIKQIADMFRLAQMEVIAPKPSNPANPESSFVKFEGEENKSAQTIELELLEQMKSIKDRGFSYFANPEGKLGASASYELAFAHSLGLPSYFLYPLADHPAYAPPESVISPLKLVNHITEFNQLPPLPHLGSANLNSVFKRVFN